MAAPCSKCSVAVDTKCDLCEKPFCTPCFQNNHSSICSPYYHPSTPEFIVDFAKQVQVNEKRFQIVAETSEMQLAYAHLKAGEIIEKEQHVGVTQLIRVEKGTGSVEIFSDDSTSKITPIKTGDVIVIPASTYHEVRANQGTLLKLSTIYSPPTTHE